jgi:hypothetical protein
MRHSNGVLRLHKGLPIGPPNRPPLAKAAQAILTAHPVTHRKRRSGNEEDLQSQCACSVTGGMAAEARE